MNQDTLTRIKHPYGVGRAHRHTHTHTHIHNATGGGEPPHKSKKQKKTIVENSARELCVRHVSHGQNEPEKKRTPYVYEYTPKLPSHRSLHVIIPRSVGLRERRAYLSGTMFRINHWAEESNNASTRWSE